MMCQNLSHSKSATENSRDDFRWLAARMVEFRCILRTQGLKQDLGAIQEQVPRFLVNSSWSPQSVITEGESMPQQEIHSCQCPNCLGLDHHPDKELHPQMNLLLS